MLKDVVIEPMTEEFIVWRCLHDGPFTRNTINHWPSDSTLPLASYRERNTPLLLKLTRAYGCCAMLARDADNIVGFLRFYPRVVHDMKVAGGLCLQQEPPAGPNEHFADIDFPHLAQIKDKTLVVYCMMTGSPLQQQNPYLRKGIATRLVGALIEWARANGWHGIEADAFEDLPIIYDITGSAGRSFWAKQGFRLIDRYPHPDLQEHSQYTEFITTLQHQAVAIGLDPERARDRLVMRYDL